MERLTEEDYGDSYCLKKCHPNDCYCEDMNCPINNCGELIEALRKLGKYEKEEEQGLLVRLPCKVGDTVYRVNAGAKQQIIPMTVSEIHFLCYKNERAVRFDAIGKEDMGESCYRLEDIGRIVFLAHEEAEKKLEELKNGK